MEKKDNENHEWWIKLGEVSEGPFSIFQLRSDSRVNPDTLVWKKGFVKWLPIRQIAELAEVFADASEQRLPADSENKQSNSRDDELVIDSQKDPFDFFYWLILAVMIISYVLYQFYWI